MSDHDLESGKLLSSMPMMNDPSREAEYLKLDEAVKRQIFQISSNISTIQDFIRNIGTPRDTHEHRDQLSSITEQTKDLIKSTNDDMHKLGSFSRISDMRKLQQSKLVKDFQGVIKRFQEAQKVSVAKSREFVARAKSSHNLNAANFISSNSPVSDGGYSHIASDEDDSQPFVQLQQRIQQRSLDSEIMYNEAIIAEREEGIRDIEATIVEVNEIFRDLGTIVTEQQGMIDNIESNVENTADYSRKATTELIQAAKHQKAARKRMCCMLVILAILVMVVVIILVST